ncbi:sensor histidine kinase [Marisediminicola sp. LYQ134]|uniref:sensor histidine kinase n=1 Tax=Marisediminicola sp. LYQ134 TaxID=3391061 RepID=UPI0039831967
MAATPSRVARNPISRRQIETVIARSSGVFGLAFGAQTLPTVFEQAGQTLVEWSAPMTTLVFGSLVFAGVASALKRWIVPANVIVVVAWFAAMISWPLSLSDPSAPVDGRPWPWFLCTVATAAAAVAWPVWASTATLFIAPLTYGVVRLSPAGGETDVDLVALDIVYAVLLGGAVLIIITLLRQAAAAVDLAQSLALERYSTAIGQHATEVERVRVDAIVHDSVLTTLLASARAVTADSQRLSARMALNAMGYVREAATSSPSTTETVSLAELARRISDEVVALGAEFEVRSPPGAGESDGGIPGDVAEAVYSAAVQSMVNSVQHAGTRPDVARWVSVGRSLSCPLVIEVGDTGDGFVFDEVPTARIGLRVSIIERVANAGGKVDVDSAPGEGTVVTIRWPDPSDDGPPAWEREAGTGVTTA